MMFLNAENAGSRKKLKGIISQRLREKSARSLYWKGAPWECPQPGPYVRNAVTILHTGGCGSFGLRMRVRYGFSDVRSAGIHGESIANTQILLIPYDSSITSPFR